MGVKSVFTFYKKLNISHLCFAGAILLVMVSLLFIRVPDEKYRANQKAVAIRAIGDAMLKANNDLQTPVPPIRQKDAKTSVLEFKAPISIDPDRLASLALEHLHAGLVMKSIVNVRAVETDDIVYGFEIDHRRKIDIPCIGRLLPKAKYRLEVRFFDDQAPRLLYANIPAVSTMSFSMLFAFLGLSFLKKKESLARQSKLIEWNGIQLDIDRNLMHTNQESISLTEKETQILALLIAHPGQLVTRDFFHEQIWLKEGVVTNRSLDMYISRLRKKIKPLSNLEIANQHGKGYYIKKC